MARDSVRPEFAWHIRTRHQGRRENGVDVEYEDTPRASNWARQKSAHEGV